ncbi:sugar phosphate isomerase/epimerase [Egibacter rhizosphaerae]|uniref:Sugar phosphate isomerase/epimerase n=1 Tax=Egibacter rhizosphaerae TaxID=1670831 RepID=A0A411YL27_9ACTN|nr:sugar phosphate isomerase/epimerase [Egibacter rhizosphaerae]
MTTPAPGSPELARLSLNQKTTQRWSVPEAVEGCVQRGIPAIGLWREHVAATGVEASARAVREAGLRVSSLCRGGFLTADDDTARREALDDNRRAIEEAATLGAECLVLVVGGLPKGSRDLDGARERVRASLEVLAPAAADHGVRLALEPLHPMYCADRAVLSTLGQALDFAEPYPPDVVGVAVDTFHIWWDPDVRAQILRAGPRIATFQVCDWLTPLPCDVLMGRGMMGDGHIDFAPLRDAVAAAGYTGDIEVEIFNDDVWDADPHAVLDTTARRYVERVLRA